jgi:hypothetical protein
VTELTSIVGTEDHEQQEEYAGRSSEIRFLVLDGVGNITFPLVKRDRTQKGNISQKSLSCLYRLDGNMYVIRY